jgi:hypothetical protein
MKVSVVVERLEDTDVSALDATAVATQLRQLERVRGFVAETEHALARRADELAAAGAGAPATEVLGRVGHCSSRQAGRTAQRAATLGDLPRVAAQLGRGRIGIEHADTLSNAARRLDDTARDALMSMDDELARAAAATTPAQFHRFVERIVDQIDADAGLERAARQRRATHLAKGINEETGMYWLRAEYDPESGARLFRAIEAEARALASAASAGESADHGQLAAQAMFELVTSANRSRRPGKVELLALIDVDTMANGLHERSTCELGDGTVVPVATMRRLACDAHILPIVLNGDGVVLDVGRSRRLATEDQRRALRAMYRTCGIGECDVPFDRCEIHHIDEWDAQHGDTNHDRLIPGCSRHHHLLHEGGWTLELDPRTRALSIRLPDGTVHRRSRPHSAAAPTARPAA